MPRNMTMQEPGARVIFLEGNRKVAVRRKVGNVATRRVDQIQDAGIEVEDTSCLADDPEVVAMEMNRVVETDSAAVLDHIDCPLVSRIGLLSEVSVSSFTAQIKVDSPAYIDRNDVVISWPNGLVVENLERRGIGPVQKQRGAVDGPGEVTSESEAERL